METRRAYPFDQIEPKWQQHWLQHRTFRAADPGEPGSEKPKLYILDMFPYPSGAGLHVGHPEGYTATDILCRFQRMRGFNVLHPMGWDAFGLPAEQYAIKTGQHPRITTEANISNFRRQIQSLGFSYDWDREVNTTAPDYFRWTQWIFLRLYNSWFNPDTNQAEPIATLPIPQGLDAAAQRDYQDSKRLAFVSEAPVNWCPELGTVLANEEVIDGKSEVGGFPVVRKPMRQWMLRITSYAQRLLDDLDTLDWTDSLKEMQRNWIGRSEGARVRFQMESGEVIEVYTTRPDTLFGATYLVLSPEHKLIPTITRPDQADAVASYQKQAAAKSDLERTDLAKDKTGVFTGAFAINPVNGEKIPVWVADYVLASYGTGAIMAVPAHDSRDLEFAQKFSLPVRIVVQSPEGEDKSIGFTGDGISVNSGFLSGLTTTEAKKKISAWLQEQGLGASTVNYKLRDWLFSRQRFWGEPFPIVWKDGKHSALPEDALPVLPPDLDDFKPTPTGDPPLARAPEWLQMPDGSSRETNTMPQWAGSCWYYLRYIDPTNTLSFCDSAKEKYWMGTTGVDLYVGGTEHAVLHLLYARFWHKVLFDLGLVSTAEPFKRLVNQGLILGEDGQKMSKSRGNVVNPDDVVAEYGADSLRCYEMFMGPLEQTKPWSMQGIHGVHKFLARAWRLFVAEDAEGGYALDAHVKKCEPSEAALRITHQAIAKVTDDLENLRANTAIAALMVWVNEMNKLVAAGEPLPVCLAEIFVILLSPLAPHLAEELWRLLGHDQSLAWVPWPIHDPKYLVEESVEIVVQFNGKIRHRLVVPTGSDAATLEKLALACPEVVAQMGGKSPRKVIAVPDKLVNFVL